MSMEFLVTSLIVVLIPGTGVIYTISTGILAGWRAAIFAAFGCTLGIVPHVVASVAGLAALLHVSALAFQAVKFAGVAYLFYLAWLMWRDSGGLTVERRSGLPGVWRVALQGFLINILNPKLSLFFLAFLPQFIPVGEGTPLPLMFVLSGTFMLMTFLVFALYGIAANLMRTTVIDSPAVQKYLQRSFAVLFAGLGCKLALAEK